MSYYKRKYLIKIRKLDSNLTMASKRLEYGTHRFSTHRGSMLADGCLNAGIKVERVVLMYDKQLC